MDKYTVIKNGLVLTLDRKSQSGYFNIIIKNNKIFLIDYENTFNEKEFIQKNPDAEITDAKDKLIMPGFFNSKLNSSYSLNKIFFRKCNYENLSSWLSLKLIDNYLSKPENGSLLSDLLKISYAKSLLSGELFINESSFCIKKDFFDKYFKDPGAIAQYFNLTSYDYSVLSGEENFVSLGLKVEEDINNYSLTSVKKNLAGHNTKLIVEASLSKKAVSSIKNDFGRSFINVLADTDLISGNTIVSNPNHLSPVEIEILKTKKSTILILPSDYVNLSAEKPDADELILSGLKQIIGTGYTGNDILSELKILTSVISKGVTSYENIIRMATVNPSVVFGISNITGTIERNKSADFIFFELNDLRNFPPIAEPESENICEFIVNNLTSKDISDVFLKGKFLIKDRKEIFSYADPGNLKAKEISDKIYSAGKYFEYKEKYLMRGRVDKLGLDPGGEEIKEPVKEEIFVDMTETGEYVGEGEFTILGTKEEDFEKLREKEEPEVQVNLKEIKSLEFELNLFDEETEIQEVKRSKLSKRETKPEKIHNEVKTVSDEKKPEENSAKELISETGTDEITEEVTEQIFKTVKLKFGFKDEE